MTLHSNPATLPLRKAEPWATIHLAGTITAQGTLVRAHDDGRLTISTGRATVTGWPIARAC